MERETLLYDELLYLSIELNQRACRMRMKMLVNFCHENAGFVYCLSLGDKVHLRAELSHHVVLGEDNTLGNFADTVGAVGDGEPACL